MAINGMGEVACGLPSHRFGRCSDAPLITEIGQTSPTPEAITEERVYRLPAARVACANYHAILRDFPQIFGDEARRLNPLPGCEPCANAGRLCRKMVNHWLVRNAAFISRQQTEPNSVNSEIEVDWQTSRTAYRPPHYGRAVVVPIDDETDAEGAKFLDLKGAGVIEGRMPTRDPHCDGLEFLGNALADFFYGWLIDTIFARACPSYHVLPVYAVLDLGFDIFGRENGRAPAGMHVRRAHSRPFPPLPMSTSDHEKLTLHVELILRYYGLTSATYGTALTLSDRGNGPELRGFGKKLALETEAEQAKAKSVIEVITECGAPQLSVANIQSTNELDWNERSIEIFDFGHITSARSFTLPFANKIRDAALGVGRVIKPDDPSYVRPNREARVDPELCDRESVNAFGFYAADKFRHAPGLFDQARLETILRVARIKAFGRSLDRA